MPLAQTQALLARLFVDAAFRRAFLDDPVEEGLKAGLGRHEAETLARIDAAAVERFAASLRGKRALDVRKSLRKRCGRATPIGCGRRVLGS